MLLFLTSVLSRIKFFLSSTFFKLALVAIGLYLAVAADSVARETVLQNDIVDIRLGIKHGLLLQGLSFIPSTLLIIIFFSSDTGYKFIIKFRSFALGLLPALEYLFFSQALSILRFKLSDYLPSFLNIFILILSILLAILGLFSLKIPGRGSRTISAVVVGLLFFLSQILIYFAPFMR